jgi:hypothetical protein
MNKWLVIIIILFISFIIIPVFLKAFNIKESFIDPLLQPDGSVFPGNDRFTQINSNIRSIYDAEIDLSNNLQDIYNINLDLSNNIYRKKDAKIDISNNFYDTSGNSLLKNILSQLQGLTTKIDKCDVKPEDIDCIADFGTNIGDDLCCNQPGILTDTKYVCPANYPKCGKMECGTKYGICGKA